MDFVVALAWIEDEKAETQTNLPAHLTKEIMSGLENNPELDVFNDAYDEIVQIIRRDVFPRFKKSVQYRALLH